MKKICLLVVSFLMSHSLTTMDKYIVKKSIDNYDQHFQSLCPSLSWFNDSEKLNSDCHNNSESVVKIDREDNSESRDCLVRVRRDCTGSISKFREFTKNYFPEVL